MLGFNASSSVARTHSYFGSGKFCCLLLSQTRGPTKKRDYMLYGLVIKRNGAFLRAIWNGAQGAMLFYFMPVCACVCALKRAITSKENIGERALRRI